MYLKTHLSSLCMSFATAYVFPVTCDLHTSYKNKIGHCILQIPCTKNGNMGHQIVCFLCVLAAALQLSITDAMHPLCLCSWTHGNSEAMHTFSILTQCTDLVVILLNKCNKWSRTISLFRLLFLLAQFFDIIVVLASVPNVYVKSLETCVIFSEVFFFHTRVCRCKKVSSNYT